MRKNLEGDSPKVKSPGKERISYSNMKSLHAQLSLSQGTCEHISLTTIVLAVYHDLLITMRSARIPTGIQHLAFEIFEQIVLYVSLLCDLPKIQARMLIK